MMELFEHLLLTALLTIPKTGIGQIVLVYNFKYSIHTYLRELSEFVSYRTLIPNATKTLVRFDFCFV